MKKTAYSIGTIELMPYPEHGEFVIVGVFAIGAKDRDLTYRLLPSNQIKRPAQFFPELERKLFAKVLRELQEEWERLEQMVNKGAMTAGLEFQKQDARHLFATLTMPREGMIRQTARATILTDNIEGWMNNEFQRMVYRIDQTAASPEEQRLTREVKELLVQWKVKKAWKERKVGNEDYHATFPFTYQPEEADQVLKAIKPLHLAQNSATKIIDHGDFWLGKVRRLRQFKLAPETIVFPVELPKNQNSEHYERANLVVTDFQREGIHVLPRRNFMNLQKYVQLTSEDGLELFSKRA
ncbi:MAG: DUF3037 domain-containing protein [Verrucomicrobiota bacterium JB023]|nr:DUF3037 domain-containing protein [Verrucomicrobiota bacterium JB023]